MNRTLRTDIGGQAASEGLMVLMLVVLGLAAPLAWLMASFIDLHQRIVTWNWLPFP